MLLELKADSEHRHGVSARSVGTSGPQDPGDGIFWRRDNGLECARGAAARDAGRAVRGAMTVARRCTLLRRRMIVLSAAGATALAWVAITPATASATPISLLVPQATAFTVL